MNDLIPRAAAIEAFDDERVDRNYGDVSPESVIKVIESIPAVNAAPVVHGKQEPKEPYVEILNEIDRIYRCPTCHKSLFYEKQKYCDQCGQAIQWYEERRRPALTRWRLSYASTADRSKASNPP